MDIIAFYTALLQCNHVTGRDGAVGLYIEDQPTPITVSKKTLVLPTPEMLASYNDQPDEVQIFHPVSENVLRKDSAVFNFLKRLYRTSLTNEFEQLCRDFINYVNNPKLSEKSNKAQRKYLTHLAAVDEKTIKALDDVFSRVDANGDNKVIDFSVLRGETLEGTKYSRVAYAHLPLYNALKKGEDRPFGVKLRKKDVEVLLRLHEAIFDIDQEDHPQPYYAVGSNSAYAPNFDSLTQAYHHLKVKFTDIIHAFGEKFTAFPWTDLSWTEGLGKIDVYRALVPAFPGNDGEATHQEEGRDRRRLEEPTPVKVTPLGTRREIQPKKIEEPDVIKPMTWAEIKAKQSALAEDRLSRRDDRYRDRRGYDRGASLRDRVDLSGVDPDYQARDRYERDERRYDRYRDYDRDDRRGRSVSRWRR